MSVPRPFARAALVLLALLAIGGCGGASGRASPPRATAAAARARLMRLGAAVFAEHCATCHPLLGRPNVDVHTDTPPLDLDQVRPTRAYTLRRLAAGGVGMGSFEGELDAARLSAVAAYVLAVGGREVTVPERVPSAVLARGSAVYEEHCQACHAIAGRPATRPNPIWAGTSFEDVRPSVLYVEQKVREGQREAMPSFRDTLRGEDVRAVALYVNRSAR